MSHFMDILFILIEKWEPEFFFKAAVTYLFIYIERF